MGRAGRLAGAILAETQGNYYLVGNLKEPCDFLRAGFEPPPEIDPLKKPYLAMKKIGAPVLSSPALLLEPEGEALARTLARCFMVERNGSISERLWNLVAQTCPKTPDGQIDARWLGSTPPEVWKIVRDNVLKCL
jgi:hypothetical protein